MNIVDDPVETIHVYMVREEEQRAPLFLPLFGALLCLAVIVGVTAYSAANPTYEHQTLTLPAHTFSRMFRTTQPIVATGIKSYPATTAHGSLTITNGSVVSQELPAGLIFTSKEGIEVETDTSGFVPPGSAAGFGAATVSAHSIVTGLQANIAALSIDAVYGTSLYIRNLEPFRGGQDAYSVRFVTQQDKVAATDKARAIVASQVIGLHYPCKENRFVSASTMTLSWRCQFVTYRVPSYMQVTRITIQGKNLLVDVVFVARPTQMWVR